MQVESSEQQGNLQPEGSDRHIEGQQDSQGSSNTERFIDYTREVFYSPAIPAYIENVLRDAGVLSELENAEILPLEDNMEERKNYTYPISRDQALKYLYVGQLVGFFRGQPRNLDATQKRGILDTLKKTYNTSGLDVLSEIELEEIGLLPHFEAVGIIPVVEQPSPYSQELWEEQATIWWDEHPVEAEKFGRETEHRWQALEYIFIGMKLATLSEVEQAMLPDALTVSGLKSGDSR